jgi:hypothetical protein
MTTAARRRVKLDAADLNGLQASSFTKARSSEEFFEHRVASTDLRPKDLIFDNEVAYYSCIRQHSTFALHSYPHVPTHSLGVIQLLHESEHANS